jgi:hypothetical protein
MPRAVAEWIGASPDSPVPDRVKLRVLEKFNHRCHWSDRPITEGDAWDVDHVKALINEGENRESNLAPILRGKPHKEKTAQDMQMKSKAYQSKRRRFRLHKAKQPIQGWKKFDGTPVRNPRLAR